MNAQTPDTTLEKQIAALDERFSRLLGLLETLSTENTALKAREAALSSECETLRERNEKASARLNAMIQRLKNPANGDKTHEK